jgi:hypothetical protein
METFDRTDDRDLDGVVKRSSPLFLATSFRIDSRLLLLFSLLPTGIGVVFLHALGENFDFLIDKRDVVEIDNAFQVVVGSMSLFPASSQFGNPQLD